MPSADDRKILDFIDRKSLRKWLKKNHTQKESVWLILHKKNSTKGTLTYNDAVEQGLCFGWIDTKPNKIDDETYKLLFAPRKSKSMWSKINKEKIEQLKSAGLMQTAGLEKIEQAKKDGSWNLLDAVDKLEIPADLKKAFTHHKKAKQYFEAFPASVKKQIIWWISSAKTVETKLKRITETVKLAEKNIRANQYQPKK